MNFHHDIKNVPNFSEVLNVSFTVLHLKDLQWIDGKIYSRTTILFISYKYNIKHREYHNNISWDTWRSWGVPKEDIRKTSMRKRGILLYYGAFLHVYKAFAFLMCYTCENFDMYKRAAMDEALLVDSRTLSRRHEVRVL